MWQCAIIGTVLGNDNLTCYHVNESTQNNRGNETTMDTMFSMWLVLESYKYEWNTLINARYTANSIPFVSAWHNATGKLWVI
jgi:hypothetical protein